VLGYAKYFMLMNLLNQDVKTGPFMDFEVKKDMRIAPSCRVSDLDVMSMAKRLDEHLACQVTDELQSATDLVSSFQASHSSLKLLKNRNSLKILENSSIFSLLV